MPGKCVTVNLLTLDIIATTIVPSKTTCTEPCDLTVDVTWKNFGDTDEFTPSIKIDDIAISPPQYIPEILATDAEVTHSFTITGLKAGSHTICPDPDKGIACAIITVESAAVATIRAVTKMVVTGSVAWLIITQL